MTTFRKDTSFPYLALARQHGVLYGTVLRVAEQIENNEAVAPHLSELAHLVSAAVMCEHHRRRSVKQ